MTIRTAFAAALAGLFLTAAVAPAADAATPRRAHAPMHAMKPMKGMKRVAMRRAPMRTGGDAQNADVDRLNDQALARARAGQ